MALALANGDIDIASSDDGTILAAIEGGLDIKAFLGLTIPDFVLIADVNPSIARRCCARQSYRDTGLLSTTAEHRDWLVSRLRTTRFMSASEQGRYRC